MITSASRHEHGDCENQNRQNRNSFKQLLIRLRTGSAIILDLRCSPQSRCTVTLTPTSISSTVLRENDNRKADASCDPACRTQPVRTRLPPREPDLTRAIENICSGKFEPRHSIRRLVLRKLQPSGKCSLSVRTSHCAGACILSLSSHMLSKVSLNNKLMQQRLQEIAVAYIGADLARTSGID